MIETSAVLAALSLVDDPDLKKDLVTLNMIQDLTVDGKKVSFRLVLTTPACPLKESIKKDCINSIHKEVDPNLDVEVIFDSNVTSNRADEGPILPGVKNIIAVASGKGGVGKSTVAVNLACALSNTGASVGIIDADIYGPSLPTLMGLTEARPGIVKHEDKNRMVPVERFGIKTLSIGYLVKEHQALVWRGPMASSALKQFVVDAEWGELDYLVLDLPPGTGDIHLTLVQTVPITGAVVITTPQELALADVKKAIAMFQLPQINVPVLGIVENMAWFTPAELPDNKYYLFGKGGGEELSKTFDVPLLAQLPIIEAVQQAGDVGTPVAMNEDKLLRAPFDELAQIVAQQVAIRNAEAEPTEKVEFER